MIHPEPIPMGVTDSEGRFAAIGLPSERVELINLRDGQSMGHLPVTGHPLMVDGDVMIGYQTHLNPSGLRLFRLALPPNEVLIWSKTVDLPSWVNPHPHSDSEFVVKFFRDGNTYVLFWKAKQRCGGGAPPPQLQNEIGAMTASERLNFDILTLDLTRRTEADFFDDEQFLRCRGEELARHAGGFVYRHAGQIYNAPWETTKGKRFLRSFGKPGDPEQPLSIVEDGVSNTVALNTIPAIGLDHSAPELSSDGEHIAIQVREHERNAYAIHSAIDGRHLANVSGLPTIQDFRVFGHHMIYLDEHISGGGDLNIVVTRSIHDMDLKTNKIIWSRSFESETRPNLMFLPAMQTPPFMTN